MTPASRLDYPVIFIYQVVASKGIRLQDSLEVPQVALGMFALALCRGLEPHRRRRVAIEAVIPHVHPQVTWIP
ncbi:hypothetical protein D9M72_466650 [compost metagenome]